MIAVAHNATRAILHHFRVLAFDSIIKTRIFENYANAISFYHSPMKKKGALPAGIPRASGERNSPVGNGAFSHNQVSLFHTCTVPICLCIAAASVCLLPAMPFVMILGPRWGDGSKSLIPHAAVACKKCKRPGGNLCSQFRFYRADQPCHTPPHHSLSFHP